MREPTAKQRVRGSITARPAHQQGLRCTRSKGSAQPLLHQTVTVIVVYGLLTLAVPPAMGFLLGAAGTFLFTWAIYAGLVRPWRLIRPLFGLKAAEIPRVRAPG